MGKWLRKLGVVMLALTLAFQPCLVHAAEADAAEVDMVDVESAEVDTATEEGIASETELSVLPEETVTEAVEEEITKEPQAAVPTIHYYMTPTSSTPVSVSAETDHTFIARGYDVHHARWLGYTFFGWSVNPNSTTVSYLPGQEYTITKDVSLYGVWLEGKVIPPDVKDKDYAEPANFKGMRVELNFMPEKDGYYYIVDTSPTKKYIRITEAETLWEVRSHGTDNSDGHVRIETFLRGGHQYYLQASFEDSENISSGTLFFKL